ncbi:MAG: WD40 repeat domain-containing protein [Cyanobacteria bacterium J007]|nr:MAG: WD40 repeat domain-containing protein [Cyanobacteria bacterium J007]
MEPGELAKLEMRLYKPLPGIGGWLRQQAAQLLVEDRSAAAAQLLAQAAIAPDDERLNEIAIEALRKLEGPEAIDAVCAVWASTRHERLTQLLLERRWIARHPLALCLLTALKVGQVEQAIEKIPDPIKPLLKACRDRDVQIAHAARQCLFRLQNPEAIDALCKQWAMTRTPFLEQVLLSGSYIARQPLLIRVLSALKVGQMQVVTQEGGEVVEPLLIACRDVDGWIVMQALVALRQLQRPKAREEVCRWAIERDHPLASEAAIAAKYAPSDPQKRALFYYLTEQWADYDQLDIDGSLLQNAYLDADEAVRSRIADKARKAGRLEIVETIVGPPNRRRLGEMSDREWENTIAILARSRSWSSMWKLAQQAPPAWSVRLLRQIEPQWQPQTPNELSGWQVLHKLASQCIGDVSALAGRMHCSHAIGPTSQPVTCFAIGPTSVGYVREPPLLAIALANGTVELWNTATGERVNTLGQPYSRTGDLDRPPVKHGGPIECLAFSHPGVGAYGKTLLLATGSDDRSVRLWRISTGQALQQLKGHTGPINCLAISPTGEQLATGSADGTVRLWRLPTGSLQATLTGHTGWINCLAISPDGQLLATGSADGTVRLWLLPSGEAIQTLTGHAGPVECLAISPDGQLLATASWDTTVRLWWLPVGAPFKTLSGHRGSVACLAFSPDGSAIATGSNDYSVRLWKLPDAEPLPPLEGHTGSISCLAFNPTGELLATGSWDRTVRLWHTATATAIQQLRGHEEWVMGLQFSDNGQVLATSSADKTVRLWTPQLARLSRLPVGALSTTDLEFVRRLAKDPHTSDAERSWLRFLMASIRWNRHQEMGGTSLTSASPSPSVDRECH